MKWTNSATGKTIEIYNSDCMPALESMQENEFELAIVDPEYGINVNKMNMGSRQTVRPTNKEWDNKIPDKIYFEQILHKTQNQIIWGGNYFIEYLKNTRCFLIWDKGEMMYGRSFADCEMAWTSFDKSARIKKINPIQLQRFHPTQKPAALYKWLLKNYAKENDRILDTHLGSGSIAIACWDMGFDLVGYELDKDYFKATCKRLDDHFRQGVLAL